MKAGRFNPFKKKFLQAEPNKSIKDIVYESPHTYQYDKDGNLKYEFITYNGEMYIREHTYSILEKRKSVSAWKLML